MRRVFFAAVWLILVLLAATLRADEAYKSCVICQGRIVKTVYLKTSPYLQGKQPICPECIKIEQECFICELPVKNRFVDLKDGRFLCERDAKVAILSGETAQQIFDDVKRDLMAMFARTGRLPDRNVTFTLVNRRTLEDLYRVQRFPHGDFATLGLTRTQVKGEEFKHEIFVLNGIHRGRFIAVAAHEYGHAWLQENVSHNRVLDSDTVEGFCELVAYRLIQQKNHPIELAMIVTNTYTRGQIHAFLQVDASRFYEIGKWMRSGVDQKLDPNNINRVFVLQQDNSPPTVPAWAIAAKPVSIAPSTLQLRSISGTPRRRFALINDQTLAPNEQAKVRLGSSNVTVRCLEVSDRAAVIQLVDSGERRTLRLADK